MRRRAGLVLSLYSQCHPFLSPLFVQSHPLASPLMGSLLISFWSITCVNIVSISFSPGVLSPQHLATTNHQNWKVLLYPRRSYHSTPSTLVRTSDQEISRKNIFRVLKQISWMRALLVNSLLLRGSYNRWNIFLSPKTVKDFSICEIA